MINSQLSAGSGESPSQREEAGKVPQHPSANEGGQT